jgi:hypothetical protein
MTTTTEDPGKLQERPMSKTKSNAWYRQPVMWIVVLLPVLSVIGGGAMVVLSALSPDQEVHSERLRELPPVDAP